MRRRSACSKACRAAEGERAACSVHGRGVFLPKCGRGPSRFWPSAALQYSLACASERRDHSVACAELRRCFRCLVYDDRLRTLATSQDGTRSRHTSYSDSTLSRSIHVIARTRPESREPRIYRALVARKAVLSYCIFMFQDYGFRFRLAASAFKNQIQNSKSEASCYTELY